MRAMEVVSRLCLTGLATSVLVLPAFGSPVQRVAVTGSGAPGVDPPEVSSLLARPAELDVYDVSLSVALTRLSERSRVSVAFSPNALPRHRRVSCACASVTVAEALDRILAGTAFDYIALHEQVVLVPRPAPSPERDLLVPVRSRVQFAGLPSPSPARSVTAMGPPVQHTPVQDTVVGGVVVNARTGQPVAGAHVVVVGTSQDAITNAAGEFRIVGLPPGDRAVEIRMLGYRQARVPVVGGQEDLVIELAETALDLDAIVVTGTAGGTQRRAIGNVVAQVNTDEVLSRSPVANVNQLLAQRTPGLMMLPGTAQVGTGSAVRIRGAGTITQGNDPIVYIDGARMDSNPRRGPGQRGGANVSRLNDIHPADIESIEIIKGPAAATLYGTEASNGVIQIITRRGATGAPQFDFTARAGTNWLWNPEGRVGMRYMPDPDNPGELFGFNVYEHERLHGTGPIFGYGMLQSYNLSMRGGTDAVRYYGSISRDHDVGVVDWNWDKRIALRGNIEALLTENLTVSLGTSYISGDTRLAQGSIDTDPFSNLVWSNPRHLNDARRGWRGVPPEEWSKAHSRSENDRTTANVELRYQPLGWLTHRLVAGLDANSEINWSMIPRQPEGADHFYGNAALGTKTVARGTRRFLTVDYAGSATFDWGEYSLQPAVGFQYYKTESAFITASGQEFPDGAITSISGATVRSSSEAFSENATVGVYVQQQVGWRNRAFVTAAIRADDNSAFGAEFDAAIYPKLSGTWVISEEPFFSLRFVDQLRLRAAWGAAGEQPGTFDAARLYEAAIGYRDQPALIPEAFGNPQLKPERGEELEIGFDASLMNGRLDVEVTRYQKAVKDAIINRPLAPSSGFPGSQVVNIGLIDVWGNELGLVARLLERPRFAWEIDTQFSTMHNEIKSLGDVGVIFGGTQLQHREGYSIADLFMMRILSAERDESGNIVAICDGGTGPQGVDPGGDPVPCIDENGVRAPQLWLGRTQPTWQVGFGTTFTLFNSLRLYARVEGNGGHRHVNTEIRATHNQATSRGVLLDDPLLQATRTLENDRTGLYEAGFLRLRELSASYDLPGGLVQRFGARRGMVSFGMRNLAMLWTAQHGWSTPRDGHVVEPLGNMITWDPEVRGVGQNDVGYQTVMPPAASATMTLRLSF